ncbi:phenylalanine--tRNA ligase subunit beta [Chloroflexota bacterium]
MKVSLNWLREYIDAGLPPAEIAGRLTLAGHEVGEIQVIGGNWEGIVVGQIVEVNPHPNADRLTLVTVDLGADRQTVVCGAPNLRVGDKVPFAHVGAELIDGHSGEVVRLKSAKIRGVASSGMVCSEKELGISGSHEGILVLPVEAPVGTPLADYLGDVVFDLEITPNRPDCLSVIGIAREVAALTGKSLSLPRMSYEETALPIDQQISVEITDPDLCPRYCATLTTGVKLAESPEWLKRRLLACGQRPINNIVDITNYVMLEHGQPLHAFDYHLVRGRKIIVRRAAEGEVLTTLDGVERLLSGDMLVIADAEGAVALAGIMGGSNSEVTEETTAILLEAANFNPANIHYTGGTLGLASEARARFERGIRAELTLPAIKRATQLIAELAGGEVARGLVDVYPGKKEHEPILLSTVQVRRVLGVEFSLEQIVGALTSLGFECKPAGSAAEVWVAVPYWRSDVRQAVDLVEEVARIIGYDQIPSTMLGEPLPRQNPEPILKLKQEVQSSLVGGGFQEVITYSLTSLEMLTRLLPEPHSLEPAPVWLANPMTVEQECLRPNLRANLLAVLEANRRHEPGAIWLFEQGKVYLLRAGDLPEEREVLCGLLSGARQEKSWRSGGEALDFFDAKGVVEGLLGRLGMAAGFERGKDESLHPRRQAAIVIDGSILGVVGELHPKVLTAFDLTEPVYMFEIDLTALLPSTTRHQMYQPIPRFPPTVRDIALIVDYGVTHRQVKDIIKSFPLVAEVEIFDVYTGEPVPGGKKSLAYRITYQSMTQTLNDEQVNQVQQQILDKLTRELGAILRA